MVVLPIPCSCSKLHINKIRLLICRASTSFATATDLTANPPTSYQPKDHHQRLRVTNNNYFSRDLSLKTSRPRTLFADQVLIKEDDHPPKIKRSEDEGLKKEVENVIMRLNMMVERMREMEIPKFIGKVKEEVSCDRILAEEMSRDIVSKFLEKPIQYLTSEDGDLEEKLKDVNILVGILEKSCPAPNQR